MEARRSFFPVLFVLAIFFGCDSPVWEISTEEGKRGIIEQTNIYLSAGDCSSAIAEIKPLYNSAYSDNEVRLITASAYACKANVNFFKLIGDLATNSALMGSNAFWALMAKLFPSSPIDFTDRTKEGGLLAVDALVSALKKGAVILPGNYINENTYNPGAMVASDRIDDANIYLLFVAMSVIGSMENRYGAPDAVTHAGGTLPWTAPDHADMPTNGCAYASAIVHLVDTLDIVASVSTGNLNTGITTLKDLIQTGIFTACDNACVAAGGSCPKCPLELRDRNKCTGVVGDMPSEAAAALATLVNLSWNVPAP